jgi:integration host factor subunit alpha
MTLENLYPFNQSSEIVNTLIEIIKIWIASGENILINGFGKFCVKDQRERRGRNPGTGEANNNVLLTVMRLKHFKGRLASFLVFRK